MRTTTGLFARLVDPAHLERAATKTVRGKRRRGDVAWFLFTREERLRELEARLRAGAWRPSVPDVLFLRDPKPRVVVRVPVEERVVHTALELVLAPIFERSASDSDFGCRAGRGTQRALLRLLEYQRRHRFALHLDVRAYFPSIDPAILLRQLRARVRDAALLALIERILASGPLLYRSPRVRRHARLTADWPPAGRGLLLGAATSQCFASRVYLQAFDHFVKRALCVPGYVRYMDDLFLFGDGRGELRRWRDEVAAYLDRELGLRLKHPRARVLACAGHVDALGARVRRDGIEPLPKAWRRLRGRIGGFVRGKGRPCDMAALERSLASSLGHLFFG